MAKCVKLRGRDRYQWVSALPFMVPPAFTEKYAIIEVIVIWQLVPVDLVVKA